MLTAALARRLLAKSRSRISGELVMSDEPPSPHAYRRCEICDGLGFLKRGAFGPGRCFSRCAKCEGSGQIYLAPVTPRLPAKG